MKTVLYGGDGPKVAKAWLWLALICAETLRYRLVRVGFEFNVQPRTTVLVIGPASDNRCTLASSLGRRVFASRKLRSPAPWANSLGIGTSNEVPRVWQIDNSRGALKEGLLEHSSISSDKRWVATRQCTTNVDEPIPRAFQSCLPRILSHSKTLACRTSRSAQLRQ